MCSENVNSALILSFPGYVIGTVAGALTAGATVGTVLIGGSIGAVAGLASIFFAGIIRDALHSKGKTDNYVDPIFSLSISLIQSAAVVSGFALGFFASVPSLIIASASPAFLFIAFLIQLCRCENSNANPSPTAHCRYVD